MTDLQREANADILARRIKFYVTENYSNYGFYAEQDYLYLYKLVLEKNLVTIYDFIIYADRDTAIREGFLSEVAR